MFDPRAYQEPLFRAFDSGQYNRFFLRWCRRAGKDKTCLNLMIREMFARVGIYYYFFPSYQQGRKAIWEGIDKDGFKFLHHFPQQYVKSINNNEMKIELLNGSIFRLIGTDNYDSVMGTNPCGCVFSEYSLQDPSAWDYIRPILAQNKGWAIFNGTPRGKNHMYDLEAAVTGQKTWFISELQSLWADLPNYYPVVTLEDIELERQSGMTEEVIEQEFGVSYVAGQKGAYYSDQIIKAREQGRIGKFMPNDHLWVDTFWDLGYRDDTAIWFRQQEGNALVWIDYYEDSGKDLAHYVQVLQSKGYRFRCHYVPHDAHQGKFQVGLSHKDMLVKLLEQAGLESHVIVAKKPGTKQQAIDAVRARFSRYFFNEPLVGDGIIKLSLYHRQYNKQRQVFLDHPVHDWTSHAADALSTEALTKDDQEDVFTNNIAPSIITKFDPLDY